MTMIADAVMGVDVDARDVDVGEIVNFASNPPTIWLVPA